MKSQTDESRIKLRSAFQTDVGVVREHNEDAAVVDEQADFFVVADGMGGHAAGEVASAMAVETVSEELANIRTKVEDFANNPTDPGRKELVSILEGAVRKAHNAVYERGIREPEKQGMGTTLDVVLLAGPEAFVAHVGDSRTYLIREGKAAQITTDHTVAEVLVIEGKLSVEEAQISPLRTILVNAIGVAPDVGVEMAHVRLRKSDQLLLCSDGLHDYFPAEQELAEHIVGAEPKTALNAMVEIAKDRGGHDNITGIIVEVLEAPESDGATAFEIELTAPATETAVPEPVGAGDTLPHSLVDEDALDEDESGEALDNSVAKETIPMRPLSDSDAPPSAREKLARASTIPPESVDVADTEDHELDVADAPVDPTGDTLDAEPDDDKTDKTDKTDKAKTDKTDKTDKAKTDKTDKAKTNKTDKADKTAKAKAAKAKAGKAKAAKPDKADAKESVAAGKKPKATSTSDDDKTEQGKEKPSTKATKPAVKPGEKGRKSTSKGKSKSKKSKKKKKKKSSSPGSGSSKS